MRVIGLASGIVLTLAAVVHAEPLDLKEVAADATWVAHLDADAVRASTLVQKAYEKWVANNPEAQKKLTEIRVMFKCDLIKDLHGVTIYAPKIKQDTGVLIIHAKVDPQHLLDLAKLAADHQVERRGAYDVHSWTDAKGKLNEHPVAGAVFRPDVLVFARTASEVAAGLDVLDGTKANLAGKDSPLAAKVEPGAAFLARATGLAEVELPVKSPLVKDAQALSLAIGEEHGESFVEGRVTMKSAETADQVKKLADGARAMIEIQGGANPDAMKFLKSVKVSVNDRAVSVQWRASTDETWGMIQKAAQRQQDMRMHNGPGPSQGD